MTAIPSHLINPRAWQAAWRFLLLWAAIMLLLVGCTGAAVTLMNQFNLTRAEVVGERLYLLGEFNSQSYQQVVEVLEQHPQVKTLVLTANPGSLDDETTFKLGREIRRRGLDTHLLNTSVIASGAVDLFLAGNRRTLEKGARLGVHSWSDGSKDGRDYPRESEEHRLNADYIQAMLGSEEFYWFTLQAAPADGLHWMSYSEVERMQLLTAAALEPSLELPPFRQEFLELRQRLLEE
ncbi:hypothetical protein [Balneatrix alpica]|uniref:COG3904 family protein n=1 Tax=Balneatrix alpica TaxID=75684 RepID=UPI002738854E|nr:hypothetical protein [Balneatrix alpica]